MKYKSYGKYKLRVTGNEILKERLLGPMSPYTASSQAAVQEMTSWYRGLQHTYIEEVVVQPGERRRD